jgi:hypothetical protein
MLRRTAQTLVLLAFAASPTLAAPKPAVQGSYEIVTIRPKKGPEVQVRPMILDSLKSLGTVWARLLVGFDGTNITITSQQLIGKPGAYIACVASATAAVTWKTASFNLGTKIVGRASHSSFKTLTPTEADQDESNCNASLDPGTYAVGKQGDLVTLKGPDGSVLMLAGASDADKPDWSKYVPKK